MNEVFKQIIENEKEYAKLSAKQFTANGNNITRENIKSELKKRGEKIREIISKTNEIISAEVMPFLNAPETITQTLAEQLFELAEALSGYRDSIDTGLAYDIHTALVQYAKSVGDAEMHIKNLFFRGLALFYLDKELFIEELDACYSEILDYSDRYEEFSKTTRNLIARAYGNSYISVKNREIGEVMRRMDRAAFFWENVGKRVDPDFPWDAYFSNMEDNLCSNFISLTRSDKNAHTVKKEQKDRLDEAATKLISAYKNGQEILDNDYSSLAVKLKYYKNTALFLAEKISARKFTDFLFDVYSSADDSYSYDNIYKRLHIGALYVYYLRFAKEGEISEEEKKEKIAKIENDVFKFIARVPIDVSSKYVTDMLKNFAVSCNVVYDDLAYLKMLLSLTVFRHKPTYVHSVMVAKIAVLITEFLIRKKPEVLVGLPGISSVEDVVSKKDEIIKFVWFAGLIHDIGKIMYSHIVSFYVRKLNNKEFEMIKQHTTSISAFIAGADKMDLNNLKQRFEVKDDINDIGFIDNKQAFVNLAQIAIGHHKSYDGKFGYPVAYDNLKSEVKTILDIITIADSIDAATDSVGRSYANKKKLLHLVSEFENEAGTRYSPVISDLILKNKKLFDAIENALEEYRFDVYYSCFSGESFAKVMEPPSQIFND